MKLAARLLGRNLRPFTLLACLILILAVWDHGSGFFLSEASAFSVLQLFATLGLPALGLGLTLLIREFDLSIAGVLGLAGTVAVLTGANHPWLGLGLGVGTGIIAGSLQAMIMIKLRLSGVAVTLGGLLCFTGLNYVLTGNESISYANMPVALLLNETVLGIFSVRSLAVVAVIIVAAVIIDHTRLGRDIVGTGSNRQGSAIAGVKTNRVIFGVFVTSATLSALTGVLLSYGLGAASPIGLADVLASAAAAAIIGGVSLVGGHGGPLGIAAGALVLCVLRSGLSSIGVPSNVNDIVTGAILFVVAVVDAPEFIDRLTIARLNVADGPSGPAKGRMEPSSSEK